MCESSNNSLATSVLHQKILAKATSRPAYCCTYTICRPVDVAAVGLVQVNDRRGQPPAPDRDTVSKEETAANDWTVSSGTERQAGSCRVVDQLQIAQLGHLLLLLLS